MQSVLLIEAVSTGRYYAANVRGRDQRLHFGRIKVVIC